MMKKNMIEWKDSIFASSEMKAMPIMTYPGLNILGKNVLEMVVDDEIQYKCLKALSVRYPAAAAATLMMALYVEAEAFGSEINYSQNEIPSVSKRLIDSFRSVENLKIPQLGTGKIGEHLRAAELATETITDCPVFGGIIGPFSLGGRLYDVTEIMSGILIEPEGSHELLQICTDFLKKYALAFKDAGCNGVIIAEPAAGLLAEKECDEFSSYYVRQIVDHVQDENFIVILHNCGNTVRLVNSMVSTGSLGIHFGNREMIKMLLIGSGNDRAKKLKSLERELERQEERMVRLQDLLVDGNLAIEDYRPMKQRYSLEKAGIEGKLNELKVVKSNMNQSIENGVGVLADIDRMYNRADLAGKKQILSSIFPEDLFFDGEKCRTPRINEVLRLILLIDSNNHEIKNGQISEFLDLSAQVELDEQKSNLFEQDLLNLINLK